VRLRGEDFDRCHELQQQTTGRHFWNNLRPLILPQMARTPSPRRQNRRTRCILWEKNVSPRTNIFVLCLPPGHRRSRWRRFLMVDNDEDVLVNLKRVLEDEGYTTATAVNYEQRLTLLSQHPFDLLVLDDRLSDRDSIEVVVDLRSSELVPPFVVVTYHWRPSRGEQARLWVLGVSALIHKLAHDELTRTVRAMLDSQQQSVSARRRTA
jgi:CheY-like chemotaxis protein